MTQTTPCPKCGSFKTKSPKGEIAKLMFGAGIFFTLLAVPLIATGNTVLIEGSFYGGIGLGVLAPIFAIFAKNRTLLCSNCGFNIPLTK